MLGVISVRESCNFDSVSGLGRFRDFETLGLEGFFSLLDLEGLAKGFFPSHWIWLMA